MQLATRTRAGHHLQSEALALATVRVGVHRLGVSSAKWTRPSETNGRQLKRRVHSPSQAARAGSSPCGAGCWCPGVCRGRQRSRGSTRRPWSPPSSAAAGPLCGCVSEGNAVSHCWRAYGAKGRRDRSARGSRSRESRKLQQNRRSRGSVCIAPFRRCPSGCRAAVSPPCGAGEAQRTTQT